MNSGLIAVHSPVGNPADVQNSLADCVGAENVLISLAAEGAVLLGGDDVLCGEAPRGEASRSAGAGDAMLAGAAAGWLRTGSLREALRLGIAAGSASVFCREQAEEIRRLYEEIVVRGMG